MKLKTTTTNEPVKKFQMGGTAPAQDPNAAAPAPTGEDQAMQQLAAMAQQIISELGPEAALALAQIIMEMLQGGGEAEAPVFKKGGRLVKKNTKKACGGMKMK